MTDSNVFVDTNICIYTLSSDQERSGKALTILSQRPLISTQIINECGSVLARKLQKTIDQRIDFTAFLEKHCHILPLTINDVHVSHQLQQRYIFHIGIPSLLHRLLMRIALYSTPKIYLTNNKSNH